VRGCLDVLCETFRNDVFGWIHCWSEAHSAGDAFDQG
ncbi:unnamed protein product, partial [marine sediment metagenome]